jgi:acetyl esterase
MRFTVDRCAPGAADRLNLLVSPLRADLRGRPPAVLANAGLDVLASENHAMAAPAARRRRRC